MNYVVTRVRACDAKVSHFHEQLQQDILVHDEKWKDNNMGIVNYGLHYYRFQLANPSKFDYKMNARKLALQPKWRVKRNKTRKD